MEAGRTEERRGRNVRRASSVAFTRFQLTHDESISTFHATSNVGKLLEKLEGVAESLATDLERTGFAGKTITLKYKLDTYNGAPLAPLQSQTTFSDPGPRSPT